MIIVDHCTNIGSVGQEPILCYEIWCKITRLVHNTDSDTVVTQHIAADDLDRAPQNAVGTESEIGEDRI